MKNSTLLFLIKKSTGDIVDVCLAMRKDGRKGRYNGIDAVVSDGEIADDVAKASAESLGVTVDSVVKCAEITFIFPHDPSSDQVTHIYISENFSGEPSSTETMDPSWLSSSYLPYGEMWHDVIFWFPQVLEGKNVRARFVFGEGDVITEKEVSIVESL